MDSPEQDQLASVASAKLPDAESEGEQITGQNGAGGAGTHGTKPIPSPGQPTIGAPDTRAAELLAWGGDQRTGTDDIDTWLITLTVMVPLTAALAIITTYCVTQDPYRSLEIGTVVGVLALAALRALYVHGRCDSADHACVDVYNMMCHRMYYALGVRAPRDENPELARVQTEGARGVESEARVFCAARNRKGLHWTLGHGYLDLYRSVLRAEEGLLLYEPVELVAGDAVLVKARLEGSQLSDRDEQLARVYQALRVLNPASLRYLPPDPSLVKGAQPQGPGTGEAGKVTPDDIIAARVMLQKAWYAINEYRHTRLLRLLRLRDELLSTMFLSALTTLLLLCLVILAGATKQAVLTGAALYGLGVTVGLFNHLATTVKAKVLGVDFGICTVQLFQITFLSGIAAVIGVYVTLALPAALNSSILLDAGGKGATGVSGLPPIGRLYDLDRYPFEAVLALIFGLTPRLLIDRLTAALAKNKEELQSTDASSTATEK